MLHGRLMCTMCTNIQIKFRDPILINVFHSKYGLLSGTTYQEVRTIARKRFNVQRNSSKRQPYVKSKFFKGSKIFIAIFWDHLDSKSRKQRTQRLKLYDAAIDLLKNTLLKPQSVYETDHSGVVLHRFYGVTADGYEFCVQVKQSARTNRKVWISVFPRKQK